MSAILNTNSYGAYNLFASPLSSQREMMSTDALQAATIFEQIKAQRGLSDQGIDPRRMASLNYNSAWQGLARAEQPAQDNSEYNSVFGNQPFVQDLKDPSLRATLQTLGPLGLPDVAEKAQKGQLTKADIAKVQQFLVDRGVSVGKAGVDGKFGPDTYHGLESLLQKNQAGQRQGAYERSRV